eukprot:gene27581-33313_t
MLQENMMPSVNSMNFDEELKLKILQWAAELDKPVKISDAKNSKFAVISVPILEKIFAELLSEGLMSSEGGRIPLFQLTNTGRARAPTAAEKPAKKRPSSDDHSTKVNISKKVSPSQPAPLQERPRVSKPPQPKTTSTDRPVGKPSVPDNASAPQEFRLADTPLLNLLDFVNSPLSSPAEEKTNADVSSSTVLSYPVVSHPTPQPSPAKIYSAIQEEQVCKELRGIFAQGGEVSMGQFVDNIVANGIMSREAAESVLLSLQSKNKVMIVEDAFRCLYNSDRLQALTKSAGVARASGRLINRLLSGVGNFCKKSASSRFLSSISSSEQ